MSKSKFRVFGRFDGVNEATVTIDRGPGTISVRPLRRKREYILPLSEIAIITMERIIKAEAREKMLARKAKRKGL